MEEAWRGTSRLLDTIHLRHFVDTLIRVAALLYPPATNAPAEWLSHSFDRLLKEDIYPSACEVQGKGHGAEDSWACGAFADLRLRFLFFTKGPYSLLRNSLVLLWRPCRRKSDALKTFWQRQLW